MEVGLFEALSRYSPREGNDPLENFITEGFAWLLNKYPEFGGFFLQYLEEKLRLNVNRYDCEWSTQDNFDGKYPDMVCRFRDENKAIVFEHKVGIEKRSSGRFVLATNVLNTEELTNDEMLDRYKEQQSVERGFSFLKDPMFLTDSIFLKSSKRIEALGLIMGLCLLVYTLGQRELRLTLKRMKTGVKNQLGRLTDRPTLRWIFQCFQSIHVSFEGGVKQISNLTEDRLHLLKFFPQSCRSYYLLI